MAAENEFTGEAIQHNHRRSVVNSSFSINNSLTNV
jgi:hypothetical protein